MEFFKKISKRRTEIAVEIDNIKREDQLWEVTYRALFHHGDLLQEGDVVSRKTVQKFAVLAMIAEEFTDRRRTKNPGATFESIFRRVNSRIGAVPEGTVRSYLSRFRAEGRISYDSKLSIWVINKKD